MKKMHLKTSESFCSALKISAVVWVPQWFTRSQ